MKMVSGFGRLTGSARLWIGALAAVALVLAACERAQLLAPTNAAITVSSPTRLLPTGGSTEITAFVVEESGTPVHNGTTVRFTTTLGRVDPVEAQTRNGVAVTTFFAGETSGVAEIRAVSGAAGGVGDESTNVVEITIGAAGVDTVTLRAQPASIGPAGGTVELIATVMSESGRGLQGIPVVFSVDQGSLSANPVTTNSSGEARTSLTTNQETVARATAGSVTSSDMTVGVRAGPALTISCAPASGSGNCASIQASSASNTATVVFTITKASGSSTIRTATIDFGDNTSQNVGNLAGGTATVTHTYNGPPGETPRSYTATVQATDINNESTSASTTVTVTPKATPATLAVTLTASVGTAVSGVGQPVTFTATVTPATGGADMVEEYEWSFGDDHSAVTNGNTITHVYNRDGRKGASVKVTTTDDRTATARTEFIISGIE